MKQFSICLVVVGMVLAACSQNNGLDFSGSFTSNFKKSHFSRDGAGGFGEKDPKILPETFYAAGRLFEGQNQWGKAAIQYQKATAVKHDFAAAYDRLGNCLGKLGQHADAVKAFERAVKLEPNYPSFQNNLGYAYVAVEDWDRAEATLRKAVALQSDFARARINLGMVLCKRGQYEQGFEQFHAVLPEPDSYYNLGLMLRGQQRYQDAAAAFNHVLNQNPQFAAAKEQLNQIQPRLAFADAGGSRLQIPFTTFSPGGQAYAANTTEPSFSTDTTQVSDPQFALNSSSGTEQTGSNSQVEFKSGGTSNSTSASTSGWGSTAEPVTHNPIPHSTHVSSSNISTTTPVQSGSQNGDTAFLPAVTVTRADSQGYSSVETQRVVPVSTTVSASSTAAAQPTTQSGYTIKNFLNSFMNEEPTSDSTAVILGSEVAEDGAIESTGYYQTDEYSTWESLVDEADEECDEDFVDSRSWNTDPPASSDPDQVLILEAKSVTSGN